MYNFTLDGNHNGDPSHFSIDTAYTWLNLRLGFTIDGQTLSISIWLQLSPRFTPS